MMRLKRDNRPEWFRRDVWTTDFNRRLQIIGRAIDEDRDPNVALLLDALRPKDAA